MTQHRHHDAIRHRAPLDKTIAVAIGWCVVITAAVLIKESEILTGGIDCGNASSWCIDTPMVFTIGLTWGAPLWLGAMLISSLLAIPMSRMVRSAFWAGTLSTLFAAGGGFLILTAVNS